MLPLSSKICAVTGRRVLHREVGFEPPMLLQALLRRRWLRIRRSRKWPEGEGQRLRCCLPLQAPLTFVVAPCQGCPTTSR